MKWNDIADFVKENKESNISCADNFIVTYKAWKETKARKMRKARNAKNVFSKSFDCDEASPTPTPSSISFDESSPAKVIAQSAYSDHSSVSEPRKKSRRGRRRRHLKKDEESPKPQEPIENKVQQLDQTLESLVSILPIREPPPPDFCPSPPSPVLQQSSAILLSATSLPVPPKESPGKSRGAEQQQPVELLQQLIVEDSPDLASEKIFKPLTLDTSARETLDLAAKDLAIIDVDNFSAPEIFEIDQPIHVDEACKHAKFWERLFFLQTIPSNLSLQLFQFLSNFASRMFQLVSFPVKKINFSRWLRIWFQFYIISVMEALSLFMHASLSFWGCCLVVMVSIFLWFNLF
jgi:hypothetical protein